MKGSIVEVKMAGWDSVIVQTLTCKCLAKKQLSVELGMNVVACAV